MILILLYLLKFVLGPRVYRVLVHIQFTLKKKVSLFGASLGLVGLKCCLDHPYAYLFFCLIFFSITQRGLLKFFNHVYRFVYFCLSVLLGFALCILRLCCELRGHLRLLHFLLSYTMALFVADSILQSTLIVM